LELQETRSEEMLSLFLRLPHEAPDGIFLLTPLQFPVKEIRINTSDASEFSPLSSFYHPKRKALVIALSLL